ncbi:MAG: PilZ domain-containing protein [Bacillota bacterium]|nr:PilZ domain-containing protein [Bacillota bacterium]
MNIKAGEVVLIRHFSGTKLFKSIVLESLDDILSVKLFEEIALLNCSPGDPVVLGCELENEVYMGSCNLLDIDKDNNKLSLKIDNYETITNKRLYERFPVSFYADVRIGESQKKNLVLVKNISINGLMINTKVDFPLYQELKFEIHLDVKLHLKASIIRKSKEANNFEYGLKINYTDVNTPKVLKKLILILKQEQEEFIRKMKDSN